MGLDPLLSELMKRYHFSVVSLGSLPSQAPTRTSDRTRPRRTPDATAFDRRAGRRDVSFAMQRDLRCEACGETFEYTFRVMASGLYDRGQRTVDSDMVRAELEHQLRRRVRCPVCNAVQHKDRRAFLRRERGHGLVGIATLGATVTGTSLLSGGGYVVAGSWGLILGLAGSLVLTLALTRWMLIRLLSPPSSG